MQIYLLFDQGGGDQAVAALALVAVHVDAVGVVVVHVVAADDRAVAAVRHVDAVLELRVVRLVELDGEVVGVAAEDAIPVTTDAGASSAATRTISRSSSTRRTTRSWSMVSTCRTAATAR